MQCTREVCEHASPSALVASLSVLTDLTSRASTLAPSVQTPSLSLLCGLLQRIGNEHEGECGPLLGETLLVPLGLAVRSALKQQVHLRLLVTGIESCVTICRWSKANIRQADARSTAARYLKSLGASLPHFLIVIF